MRQALPARLTPLLLGAVVVLVVVMLAGCGGHGY